MKPITKEEAQKFAESDPLLRLWLKGYADGTVLNYARSMLRYTRFHDLTPQQLLDLKESGGNRDAEKRLDTYVVSIDLSESQKQTDVGAIHSFYKAHYLDLASRSGYSRTRYVKVKEYKCPTQSELRDMARNSHIRDDVLINLLSSGGFREETATLLVWSDLKELWTWDGKTPIYVGVDSRRLKGEGYEGIEQHCFMTRHACEVLLRYAKWYKTKRDLSDDASLIISRRASRGTPAFEIMNPQSLYRALLKLGPYTPHDLRRFNQTQLEAARVNPNWIKKLQGKKLKGEDNPYSRPKVEEMRAAFISAEPYLTLAPPEASIDPIELRKRALLDSAAMLFREDPQKLTILEDLLKKVSSEQELLDARDKWWITTAKIKGGVPELMYVSAIVDEEDLQQYINRGFDIVNSTPSGKIVVRRLR